MAKHAQRLDSNKSWEPRLPAPAPSSQPRHNLGGHSPFAPSLLLVLPQLVQSCGVELPPNAALSSLTRKNPALQVKDARQVVRLQGLLKDIFYVWLICLAFCFLEPTASLGLGQQPKHAWN